MPDETALAQQEPVQPAVRRYALKTAAPARKGLVDYDRDLSDEQRAVALCDACPTLVIAGAGSGKTRALTYRVAHLLETGTPPSSILLLTFTNKAAREMMARVGQICRVETRRMWGGHVPPRRAWAAARARLAARIRRSLRAARSRGREGGDGERHRRSRLRRRTAPVSPVRRSDRSVLDRREHAAAAGGGDRDGGAAVRRAGRGDPARRPALRRAQGADERDGFRRPAPELEAAARRGT